jgi:3D (Asp-Asp-Asp) domain-containing protein
LPAGRLDGVKERGGLNMDEIHLYLKDLKARLKFIEPRQPRINPWIFIPCVLIVLMLIMLIFAYAETPPATVFKITAYCSCVKCCNKSDGITASGKPAKYGYVACNWLPFGSKVRIAGLGDFVVMDRGARSLFGTKKNPIKHLDVWMPSHLRARLFGKKFLKVEIL